MSGHRDRYVKGEREREREWWAGDVFTSEYGNENEDGEWGGGDEDLHSSSPSTLLSRPSAGLPKMYLYTCV